MRFSVIIPNYNSARWIEKCLDSIREQTYKDYEIIIVDDMSIDNSVDIIARYIKKHKLKNCLLEVNCEKRWNGGTRNAGVEDAKGDYIIFIDCDDWFDNNKCFEKISEAIDLYNKPDCIRLPYRFVARMGGMTMKLHEESLKELVNSIFIAPWTKCIKRELFVPFPENTLIEDVVQHIAQIDNIETLGYCNEPIVVWNRTNEDAISAEKRHYDRESKRYTSIYRNLADLLDLRCKHDYCEQHRQFRIKAYYDIIHNGKESTIV